MNHIYRLVWSKSRQMLVAVAESAGARSKGGSARQRRRNLARLIRAAGRDAVVLLAIRPPTVCPVAHLQVRPVSRAIVLALLSGLGLPISAFAQPSGGAVVAGQAAITQSGSTTNVHQGTDKAIINWNSFSIGSGETVNFYQPTSSSVALNRVIGSDPSSIYGHLNANGQVFLVNPNGVYFAPGAQVDVGGIVASTLGINNDDFLNGNYHFSGDSTASVVNDGSIIAAQGGYVAFIGNHVANNGDISTPGGTTALGAGGSVDLTLAGNSLLTFKVSSAALNALAENGGVIKADGGAVILTAQAKDALLQTVVNNTGVIQAQTVANHNGTIELLGGDSGTTQVAGTLDASAPTTGDGGKIETSGAHVKVADGTTITTKADNGNNGTWLIDPQDFTIASSGGDMTGAALSSALGSGNVTIQSSNGGTSGSGDLFVNDTVSWGANTLTLDAYRNIDINTAMNGSGTAKLALLYGQGSTSGVIGGVTADYHVNAPVNLEAGQNFSTKLGSSGSTINYTVITSLGSAGDASTPPGTMTLQGVTGGSMSANYVLGADIDASATANWNPDGFGGYYGFDPIGDGNGGSTFTGRFDGLGHTVSNLTTVAHLAFAASLFGYTSNSTIRNIGMVNANVTGIRYAGGLVGYAIGGSIDNAYATGTVKTTSTNDSVGGLVGVNNSGGSINNAYATASVSGTTNVGGLVGQNSGTINNAYATGNVSGVSEVGGLVGFNLGSSISNAYATGDVNGTGIRIGGLVGFSTNTAISNAYATGNVSGGSIVGGLLGLAYNSTVNDVYATGAVSGSSKVGGLVGSNSGSTITNGYWDITTTGKGTNAGYGTLSGTVTGGGGLTTAQLASALPTGFSSSVWTNIGNRTTPYLLANTSFDTVSGSVLLGTDTSATPAQYKVITSLTQLQNINSTGLGLNYVLGNSIDASATASWNSGSGFVPIGSNANPYQGIFDGLGYTISNLSINRNGNYIGLFGDSGGTIRNIGLVGGSVSAGAGSFGVGALVGGNAGTISNAYATTVVSGDMAVGGLVGINASTIDNAHATGLVHASNTAGGLVGVNAGTLTNVYATGDVDGQHSIGGLVGSNSNGTGTATITNAYASGTVNGTNTVGGLVGQNASGTISNAYATGSVTGGGYVGGLVGANGAGSNGIHVITNAYATGSVSGNDGVGGLVGISLGTISNTFATGKVTASSNFGGLVGIAGGAIHNSYWDTTTYGSTNVGSGAGIGLTTAQLAAALPSGFSSSVWTNIGNQTTPYLLSNTSFDTVSGSVLLGTDTSATPAQYKVINSLTQLQNINSTGLALNYVLGNNIDASATASWNAGSGFVPIGDTSGHAFMGIFDGLGYTINNLAIDRAGTNGVGLFGVSGGTIRNVGLIGGSISGGSYVGALVGLNSNGGTISNAYATSSVNGLGYVGGLAGLSRGAIDTAYATGNVSGGGTVGGLVGASAAAGTITHAYATGAVTGGNILGGLVGSNLGAISVSYATGNVISTAISGGIYLGGLVGSNYGTMTNVYATGNVGCSNCAIVGGLVGITNNGSIINAYATGNVTAAASPPNGGLVGYNSGATITNVYASGLVTNGLALIGEGGGFVTNAYWDATTMGQHGTPDGSGIGLTSTQLMQQSSYAGFDFNNIWIQYDSHTNPLLRVFMTPLAVTSSAVNKTYDGTAYSGGLVGASYTYGGMTTSIAPAGVYGTSAPYGTNAVNIGTYSSDLWSDQRGYIIDQSGVGALTIAALPGSSTGTPQSSGSSGSRSATGTAGNTMQGGSPSSSAGTSFLLNPVISGKQVLGNHLLNLVLLNTEDGGVSPPAGPCSGSLSFDTFSESGPSLSCSGGSKL